MSRRAGSPDVAANDDDEAAEPELLVLIFLRMVEKSSLVLVRPKGNLISFRL